MLAAGRILGFTWLALLYVTFASAQSDSDMLESAREYEGLPINSIQFDPSDQPFSRAELSGILPLHPGQIFHEQDLHPAIQALYSTGRFAGIAVDASKNGGSVALKFITVRAYFVGHVSIYGIKAPPNLGQLFAAAKLNLGTRYFESDRNRATQSMIGLLRANGLYQAEIDSAVTYQAHTQQADIVFDIYPGPRAKFTAPDIRGHPQRSYQNVVNATRWKRIYGLLGWDYMTAGRLQQGLSNIRNYYERRNYLHSRITLSKLDYTPSSNTARPYLSIYSGPKVFVHIAGARISRARLKQLIPVFQERAVDPDLLAEGQKNLQHYLQSIGYFGAAVQYRAGSADKGESEVITYTIQRGAMHRLAAVLIRGNRYFSSQAIRERILTIPAELPRYPRGRFSDEYVATDIDTIEDLYRSNGFRDVKVRSHIIDNYNGSRNQIAVTYSIDEGVQTLVSKLTIEGLPEADLAIVKNLLASDTGQPYSDVSIGLDRDNILQYLYDRGYLNATFQVHVSPAAIPNRVVVRYIIREGSRSFVRRVIVSGIERTRPGLVLSRISLHEGEPISLAKETDSQRRLYDLGIFARVNSTLQNPDGDEPSKYVLFDVDEARHYSLNFGVGAQIARIGGGVTTLDNPAGAAGFAPRLAFGLTRENFLGMAQTVGIQTALSTIEQRVALTYFIPQFVSHDRLNLTFTTLLDDSNDIRTFSANRKEASVQLGERVSRAYTLQYRFVYREVSQSNLKINPLLVPLLSQPETVGLTEISFIQDKRDDPTDAHHGIYSTVNVGYAFGGLGSQTQFGRALFRNSSYHQLSRNLVLARSDQFGVIARTGGRPDIPLAERLYSGGSTSIRAFPDFQAGPRDLVTGFPLGGSALLINNTELRFPVYGENLGAVLFHDAGNVYDSWQDIRFRFRQRNLQDFNYMVQDFGLGIRYRTPVGPLRIDLSVSPDAPRFFGLKGTLHDYVNGTAIPTTQKINSFQFHISLGQAF